MLKAIKKLLSRKIIPIKPGDTVVCIDDRPINSENYAPPVSYGEIYIVSNLATCIRCKKRVIDVGLIPKIPRFTKCGCDGKIARAEFPGANIHWAGEFRFRKVEKNEVNRIKNINGIRTLDLM